MPMSGTDPLILVLGILFVGAFVRSAVGFGDALIAMPVLTLLVGLTVASPLIALISVLIATVILIQAWQMVDLKAASRLIVTTFVGIPLGVYVLKLAPVRLMETVLGLIVIGFGLYNLLTPRLPQLQNQRLAYLFGLLAGILGGAYNTSGPPVVIYGVLRRWPPERFRATMQSYFLPTGLVVMISHGVAGLWTAEVWRFVGYGAPVVLTAVYLGGKVAARVSQGQFDRIIYLFLVIIGLLLIL